MHGWTHRPASQGGTDPIPASVIPYAYLRLSGQTSVTSTDSYNVDTVPGSLSSNTNDADTFDLYTDINGKKGIHVLRSGVYHWHWSAQVQENNAGNTIPPRVELYLQLMSQTQVDASLGFDDVPSNWKFPTDHAYAQYLGSGAVAANDYASLHAAWAIPTTDNFYYAPRILSVGGAANWRYGNVWVWASRIGDI